MRFIFNSKLLLENLQSVSILLTENTALPILEKCLFKVAGNTLTLVASDSESVAVVEVPLEEVTGEGSLAMPARQLMEYLKTISDIPVVFDINTETSGVQISTGTGQSNMVGESAETYPVIPAMDIAGLTAEIPSDVLVRAISKTIFATGTDQLRVAMCGVLFEMTPNGITFVATDAHKLVRYRRPDITAPKETTFVVPKKALMLLKNMLSLRKESTPVRMDATDKNLILQYANVKIGCRLIDGRYPNYEAVIPKDNPNRLTIARSSFLNCIRRVCIFASKAMPQAKLSLTGASEILVSAEDVESSSSSKERLACQYEGEPMEIGFNAKYFFEMLNNVESEDVCLKLSTPNRAGLIMPVGDDEKKEDLLMLVMPVML